VSLIDLPGIRCASCSVAAVRRSGRAPGSSGDVKDMFQNKPFRSDFVKSSWQAVSTTDQ
jgi:hypothetical protein